MNAVVEASRHIATLYPPDSLAPAEYIELRAFRGRSTGPRSWHRFTAPAVSDALSMSAKGYDVFVGIAARRCPDSELIASCPHDKRGGKDHIDRIGWAFVEIDVGKPYESVDEILERLDGLKYQPDLVTTSGAGAHAYWQLDEPTSDFARVERLTRALRKQLGHDNAIDVSRVLRVAGTVNYKYESRPLASVVRRSPNALSD